MPQKTTYLKKINNSSVVQRVIDSLTSAMINKELRPGDKIPTELELSEALGVGRLSIREAIKVLVYFGVLEIRRPEGTFVCQGFSDTMIDPMIYGIILSDDDSFTDLKELRQLMEVGIIKLVMRKCNDEDMEHLEQKYDDFKAALDKKPLDIEAVFQADNEFHKLLAEIVGNALTQKINALVRTLTHDMRYRTVENMVTKGSGDVLLDAHRQLCDMIKKKDISRLDEIVEYGYFYDRIDV